MITRKLPDKHIEKKTQGEHLNLIIIDRGLVIHKDYPHLGASQCMCCGCGVIEVKCPSRCRNKSFFQAMGETTF